MSAGLDAGIVASIIEQLRKGGPLRDGRPPSDDDRAPLADHVAREVQRSIDRIRLLRTYKPPIPLPKLADFRKAAKVLRKFAFTDEQREAARQLEAVRQTPPARADALKYRCALEAFDLMTFFSAKPPTGTAGMPFQTIAALLYEAVTREPYSDVDMKRSCDLVLSDRKQFHPNAFER